MQWYDMNKSQLTKYLMDDRDNLAEVLITLYKRSATPEGEG